MTAPTTDRHGTLLGYRSDGCRCGPCRAANAAYVRERRQAAGRQSPMVPAGLIREHLVLLIKEGVGARAIAQRSGVARSTVQAILDGTQPRIRLDTERRLREVTIEDRRPGSVVPAGPTLELVDLMVANGHTRGELASRLGLRGGKLAFGESVTAATAEAVRELALELDLVLDDTPGPPDPDEVLWAHLRVAEALGWVGQEWRAKAACKGTSADFFFADRPDQRRAAKDICSGCPVADPCLETALIAGDVGIRGGLSTAERRRLTRPGRRRAA